MIKYGILNYHVEPAKLQLSDRIFDKPKEAQKVIDKRYRSGMNEKGEWRSNLKRSVVVTIDVRELDFDRLTNIGGV